MPALKTLLALAIVTSLAGDNEGGGSGPAATRGLCSVSKAEFHFSTSAGLPIPIKPQRPSFQAGAGSPGKALKCYKCVASNENDCNQQGSHSCPQYADACSTITAPNSIIKSCSYKSFCDQARRGGSGGATVRCCFSDDCNGPAGRGSRSGGGIPPRAQPGLLTAVLAGMLLLLRWF